MSKPIVKNAADRSQVKEAAGKEKRGREREIEDMLFILSTREGRRFIWRLLSHCKVFESVWSPSALIHHNAGRQDVGHFIMAEVVDAREEALIEMMREAKKDKQ